MLNNHQMSLRKISLVISILFASSLHVATAYADERESLEQLKATTTNLIDLLVKEGVLPKDKADAIVRQASEEAKKQVKQAKATEALVSNEAAPPEDKSVRVQYVPEHIKKEMREEIKKEVMAKLNYKAGERLGLPSWIDRFSFYGDIRLRGQNDSFGSENTDFEVLDNNVLRAMNLDNASEERRRLRVRARLGTHVKVNDWLVGGLQFVTGLQNTPLTPNQTEGIAQGKYIFGLDRAYLQASPASWATVVGGRFENPFLYTDVLWDPDLAFDGFAAKFTPKLTDSVTSFTTVGAFPVEEVQSSAVNKADDKWIYSLQTGIQWEAPNKSKVKLAVAYHDFKNVEGQLNSVGLNDYSATAPAFRQRGNNTFDINANNSSGPDDVIIGLASKFQLINVLAQVDFLNFDPVHVTLTGDYVKNIGFDKNEILRRTGNTYKEETDAYHVRLDLGHNSFNGQATQEIKAHEWQVSLGYKYLEADSVLDGLTDSNFRLGGTDAKGWTLTGNYAFDKNAWISARYLSADSISGDPFSVDVFLVDLNARF